MGLCILLNHILFLIVYIYCGVSDMLDGYLARRFNIISDFGTNLDSIAKVKLIPIIELTHWLVIESWFIFIIRIIGILVG